MIGGASLNILSNIFLNQVQKSLLTIPSGRTFYYYKDEKIELVKRIDLKGIYFIHKSNPLIKIWIGRELYINFYPEINEEEISSMFEKESLIVVEKNEWLGKNYLVKTTGSSKFADALQMSNYLQETYPSIVEYSEPNKKMEIPTFTP